MFVHADATDGAEIIHKDNLNGHTFGPDDLLLAADRVAAADEGDAVAVYVAVRGGEGKTMVCPSPRPCDVAEEGVVAYKPHIEVGSYTVRVRELDPPDALAGCRTFRGVAEVGATLSVSPMLDVVTRSRGRINWPTDVDCHAITILDASLDYRIRVLGSATDDGSLPEPQILGVYYDDTLLVSQDDSRKGYQLYSEVLLDPTTTGTHQIDVGAFCLSRNDDNYTGLLANCLRNVGTYRLEIVPVE